MMTERRTAPRHGEPLSHALRLRGQFFYKAYACFNSVSYGTLSETLVVLYLLQLGASAKWAGFASAMLYAALPAMILGHFMVKALGLTRNAALFWFLRSISSLFFIVAPLGEGWFGPAGPLYLVLFGVCGFNFARAVGIVSLTGIITEITTERDRGELIAFSFGATQGGGVLVNLCLLLALLSGELYWYQFFFGIGLVSGVFAAVCFWLTPESGLFQQKSKFSLREVFGWLWEDSGHRWFMLMMALLPVGLGVQRMAEILLVKQGYGLNDGEALGFFLLHSLGGIAASYTYGFFLDKLGSRPLIILATSLKICLVLAVVFFPQRFFVGLFVFFFFSGYTHIALQASLQHYFISITTPENQLAQGIVLQSLGGVVAGVSIFLSGMLIGHMQAGMVEQSNALMPFRWFFGGFSLFLLAQLFVLRGIPPLRSHRVRDSLNTLFSPWDWRALNAVKLAVKTQNENQEAEALELILRSGSNIYHQDVQTFLRSPSYAVRDQALTALNVLQPTAELVETLKQDVRQNMFTTAGDSVYWLGRWQAKQAIPLIEYNLDTKDSYFQSRAIQALVAMGSRESLPLIERVFERTTNILVLIQSARAMSLWGGDEVYGKILEKFGQSLPPQAISEMALSLSKICGVFDDFYHFESLFLDKRSSVIREWEEFYGENAEAELLREVLKKPLASKLLLEALEDNEEKFVAWFYEATHAFLSKDNESHDSSKLFILFFLIMNPKGVHLAKG